MPHPTTDTNQPDYARAVKDTDFFFDELIGIFLRINHIGSCYKKLRKKGTVLFLEIISDPNSQKK